MNLYFRLIRILFKSWFADRIEVLDDCRLAYRVWPFDTDINLHLTNSRYFALCDLARIYFMGQVGILFEAIDRRWLPVVQAQEVTYYKGIKPFRKFEVITRMRYWDDKYWYIEHQFVTGDTLCARLLVRGVFRHGRDKIPMADMTALTGQDIQSPEEAEDIRAWHALLDSKKNA